MKILAIDVGSSSVKAQIFASGKPLGDLSRVEYPTIRDGPRCEVDPPTLLGAVRAAIPKGQVDCIALSVMSPAWVAMDKTGAAVTPIVTHQDRRSVEIARAIESRIGRERHLQLAGNRPFPGSISSTTCAWFIANQPQRMAAADLVGHLNTFLIRQFTGRRVIDPSNASFTGLYRTCDLAGWSEELCDAAGVTTERLPEILESDRIAGTVTPQAATDFGLTAGTPVLAGMIDTSAAMMLTGAAFGQLFHMCGSTDVLAVVADQARPRENLLTRALGIGRKWMSVYTLAAAGSSIDWMRRQFFRDLSDEQFYAQLVNRPPAALKFDPYLAGERASMEHKLAAFSHLSLATTREEMLSAVVEALAAASSARLAVLAEAQAAFLPDVYISGGGGQLAELMHQGWPADWKYLPIDQASLRGLAALAPR